jgi:hypothetical protein
MTENRDSAGDLLRQGRLRQRLSIVECSKRTHIAPRYIEALEEERWGDLPSESHRLGFLKLYSRFLGVPSEEVLKRYQQKTSASISAADDTPSAAHAGAVPMVTPEMHKVAPSVPSSGMRWTPTSIPQVIGIVILTFLLAWLIYHAAFPRAFDQNSIPWIHRRQSHQARLEVPSAAIPMQRVRIKATSDSWIRVTSRKELLYEGILPAGAVKEWRGQGPFQLKLANVKAVTLQWNDQPFDVFLGSHGSINDIRIPPQ